MVLKREKFVKWLPVLFFVGLFILGIFIYGDYGFSWDECGERRNGIISIFAAAEFFTGKSYGFDIATWGDRYYGMGLQHILLAADLLFGFPMETDFKSLPLWQLRHFLTYIIMLCGLIFMYLTCRMLRRGRLQSLLPVVIFFFIPRFVAESFYNIKDIGLLSAMMAGGYFTVRFARKCNWQNALYLGIAAAFVSSVRLAGLQWIAAGIVIALWHIIMRKRKRCVWRLLLLMLAAFIVSLICFYPMCWGRNPVVFFYEAVRYMSAHPWCGFVLFGRTIYLGGGTPFYYLPVWIIVTTPVPVLILLLIGSGIALKKCFSSAYFGLKNYGTLMLWMYLLTFWAEVLLLMFMVKTCYNGWRQFYFLGYPLVMLAAIGLSALWDHVKLHQLKRDIFLAVAIIICGLHVTWMVTQHPYQYLYFNMLYQDPQSGFESDYWRVSHADALRRIAAKGKAEKSVKYVGKVDTTIESISMLNKDEQQWVKPVSEEGAMDYMIVFSDPWCRKPGREFEYRKGFEDKVISDEIRWVDNSLWINQVMAYRIIGYSRTPEEKILPFVEPAQK